MSPVVRRIAAVVVGALVAVAVVSAGDAVVGQLWPLPAGADMRDPAQLRAFSSSLPATAFLLLVAGWTLAAAAGAYVATLIAADGRTRPGMIVTVLLLVATIANLAAIPHPVWTWIVALVAIPAAGWSASRLGAQRRVARPVATA